MSELGKSEPQPEDEIKNIPEETVEDTSVAAQEQERLAAGFFKVQLQYALKIHKQEIPQLNGKNEPLDFEEAIITYTHLGHKIGKAYRKSVGYEGEIADEGKYKAVKQKILADIHREYDQDPDSDKWMLKVDECIANNISALPKEESGPTELRGEHGKIGVIEYETVTASKEFEVAGIPENSICIDIHFPEIFMQKNKPEDRRKALLSTRSSLKELLKFAREKHPEVKAITGQSWLLDTSFAKRLGFTILENQPKPEAARGNGFWGQFIDENGHMRKDKLEKLLKTGEAEYYSKKGYILI